MPAYKIGVILIMAFPFYRKKVGLSLLALRAHGPQELKQAALSLTQKL